MMDAEFPAVVVFHLMVVIVCNYLVLNMSISVVCSIASTAWEVEEAVKDGASGAAAAGGGGKGPAALGLSPHASGEVGVAVAVGPSTPSTRLMPLEVDTPQPPRGRRCCSCGAGCAPDQLSSWASGCPDRSHQRCLQCCPCWGALERWCAALAAHPAFDITFLAIVVVNSAMLGWQSPSVVSAGGTTRTALLALDIVFVCAFAVEMIVKAIALGRSFYSSALNVVDLIVVLLGIASLPLSIMTLLNSDSSNLSDGQRDTFRLLRTLNVFRVVRVLRVAMKVPSMRHLLNTAFKSTRPVINIIGLSVLLTAAYALLGREVFGGQLVGT